MKSMSALLTLTCILLLGCKPEPKPIEFGFDACHYCKMTIVDQAHAAEVVSDKGKVYVFDAIECMLQFLQQGELKNQVALRLVSTMDRPGELQPASECTYLICKAIPSPMGAYLSGYSTEELAVAAKNEHGGMVYDWSSLKKKFKAGAISFSGQ